MSRTSKKLIILFVGLGFFFVLSLFLNKNTLAQRKELLENAQVLIKWEQDQIKVGLADIESVGTTEFEAILDTSTTKPVIKDYTGVQLYKLMNSTGIDLNEYKMLIITGADGFSVAYTIEEVLAEGNVYLAFKEDDEYLGGYEDGGTGPFQTIVISDTFSNRRCKWVVEIGVAK